MRTVTLTRRATLNVYLVVFTICLGVSSLGYGEPQDQIVEKIGLSRGICVILGDVTGEVTSRLAGDTELQLYVQLEHAEQVAQLRRRMDAAGLLGRRVWVEQGDLSRVHLADDLADALIAVNGATEIARAEALRVVRPQGKALVGDQVWTKPFPPGIDDWSHPYHGPDNNPQSLDRVGKAPYLTQFLAEPYYAPLTQIAVASAGRVFKAFGHVAFHEREEPFLSKLVAFNGYNGTILWKRDITPGIMVHRNTMIATPEVLYYGDDRSCKMIDTRTGRVLDEIMPPEDIAGGTYWKWMGLEEGILYAVVGEKEFQDQQSRWRRTVHGWPWNQISKGFNLQNHAWGFGRNVMAIDPKSKRILWHYHEQEPIDTRAVCMKNGRIYLFRFGAYLTALNAKNGKVLWRKTPENAPRLFATLGKDQNRQGANSQWRVACYTKCSDEAIYFAGPQLDKLVAVSTRDGRVLWQHEHGNFQLVLREEGLYCLSGNRDQQVSLRLNPLTGETLAEIQTAKRGCTRPNGSVDSILYRALGGSTRLAVDQEKPMYISPMRPECQDGVTIANGLLYWWPMSCDCQLYALDAKTEHIRWQNNSSGHLDPEAKTGASVQGHFLIHDGTLYLAGGNGLSPARYALTDGRCLNDPQLLRSVVRNNILSSQSPRGWELYLMGEEVVACGPSFYGDPKWEEYDNTVAVRTLMTRSGDRHVAWVDKKKVICYPPIDKNSLTELVTKRTRKNDRHILPQWGSFKLSEDPLWQIACPDSVAVAVTSNAVLVAGRSALTCLDLDDGKQLWSQPLPMAPVPWGVAVDRSGRVIVTLKDGQVLCFSRS